MSYLEYEYIVNRFYVNNLSLYYIKFYNYNEKLKFIFVKKKLCFINFSSLIIKTIFKKMAS